MSEPEKDMAAERDEAIRQSQGYLKHARELIDENDALRDRVAKLEAALKHARGVIEAIMSDGNCDCRKDFAIAATEAANLRVAKLEAALIEVGDFLADDCVENYPFDRIPGSFADEADRLLKLIKASVGDTPQ